MRRLGLGASWFSCLLIMAQTLAAQTQLERFDRQLEQIQRETRLRVNPEIPADQRLLLDYGGSLTFAFAAIDDSEQKTHILRQYGLTGYFRMDIDGVHQFFLRGSTTYRDFNPHESFDGHGDDWIEPALDRATYRFDLRRALEAYDGNSVPWNVVVQGGRQLVQWGNGLVLSEELDGGVVNLSYEKISLDIVAATTRESISDFDSSRPDFDSDTHRGFYGGLLRYNGARHRPYVYGLVQVDNNGDLSRSDTIGGVATTTSFKYNSWYVGTGAEGSITDHLVYGMEFAYEGGLSRSRAFTVDSLGTVTAVPQSDDPISACAMDFMLDYLFIDANHSRVGFESILATGDSDRYQASTTLLGNQPGTNDRSFNSFGLLNTGLAFAPSVSNLLLFRVGASTFPLPNDRFLRRFQVGSNLFIFNKLTSDAPIDEASNSDFYLGFEPDVYANWQITSDLTWTIRYGVFFPSDGLLSNDDPRHFVFSSVTLAF
ncbi:MAG: hypothetical protein IT440_10670 [Phycisphaeraceae bacterium]|nr:hypothetical protein [Phycisphaeraceae bacterium]